MDRECREFNDLVSAVHRQGAHGASRREVDLLDIVIPRPAIERFDCSILF